MFEKLMGKKKKEDDCFHIPQKKVKTDEKTISKMTQKSLAELISEQDKYVNILIEKLQNGRILYQKSLQKYEQLCEKNDVINAQVLRMTNQHEQLTIKFDNLQLSLQMMSQQNETNLRQQLSFLAQNEIVCDKLKSVKQILGLYRNKLQLCKKIQMQNKSLKTKYSEIQESYQELTQKLKQYEKQKGYNNLIPTLMQEIQQLKKKQEEKVNTEDKILKLEEQILQKVRTQIEVNTTSSSEEQRDIIQRDSQTIKQLEQKLISALENEKLLSEAITKYKSERKSFVQQIQSLRANTQEMEEYQKQIEAELSEKQAIIKQLEANLKELKKQINHQRTIKSKLEQAYQIERNTQQSQNDKNKNRIEQLLRKISEKDQQLESEKQKRKQIGSLLESKKGDEELQKMLRIKSKLQNECENYADKLKKSTLKSQQCQSKINQLTEQLQLLKATNKRMIQQKKVLQQTNNECLNSANEHYKNVSIDCQKLKGQKAQLKNIVDQNREKIKNMEQQVKNYVNEIETLLKNINAKQAELKKTYLSIQQKDKERTQLQSQIQSITQDMKIRSRKYEYQLNQQRIKNESMNRKIQNLQTKSEQNKVSMDNMYQQMLTKDKKVNHMQIKLKQYKYMIQILRKQKHEIERSYETKIKGLENVQQEQLQLSKLKSEESQKDEKEDIDTEQIKLKNQMLSIRENTQILVQENQKLRQTIKELGQELTKKDHSIKVLQDKRDQIIKEIQKMNFKQMGKPSDVNLMGLGSPKTIVSPKMQTESKEAKQNQGREKKIAGKAYKGFEILSKLHHQLYKSFINIFGCELQRNEVKQLQGDINMLLKKSSDMRDIFQDYL